jgi:hypothetical protein
MHTKFHKDWFRHSDVTQIINSGCVWVNNVECTGFELVCTPQWILENVSINVTPIII